MWGWGFSRRNTRCYITNATTNNERLKAELETCVRGVEIDERAYKTCINRLDSIVREVGISDVHWDVHHADTLTMRHFDNQMDFVIGNPAYVRVHDLETFALNRQINQNLEALAKQLYDYWFVQFDFPNEQGLPYRTSGGLMKYEPKLKKEIPIDWHCGNLFEIANFTNGLACQNHRPKEGEQPLPVIKIREMRDGFTNDTEFVTPNIPENVKVYNGDVLFSWSASLEVMLWTFGDGGLNQHIFKVTPAKGFPKSFYYYQLLHYVDVFKHIADARKTTMGHITQDHLQQAL